MAGELNCARGVTGLTGATAVTAHLYLNGAATGSPIECPEVLGAGGLYCGNMAGAAGRYEVQFFSSGVVIGRGSINWNGTAEVSDTKLETDLSAHTTIDPGTAAGHELNISTGITGQTVTAKLYLAGSLVGSAINCPELNGEGGYYSGSVPNGTGAGFYVVVFLAGGVMIGAGSLEWNGTSQVTELKLETDIAGITGGGGGGGEVTGFSDDALQELRDYLTGTVIVVRGPVSADDDGAITMRLTIGDDYSQSDLRAIEIDLDGTVLPDLSTGSSVELHLKTGTSVVIVSGSITVPTGTVRTVRFEPTSAQTVLLTPTVDGRFSVVITHSARTITPPEGQGVLTAVMRIVSGCN